MPLTYSTRSCVLLSNQLQLLEEGSPYPKKDSESGSLISLCGCLHAECIIHADQGFSLHPLTLKGLAPLWPLCGMGRFKAPGGTDVTSQKQLLVKINGCIFKNPHRSVAQPRFEGDVNSSKRIFVKETES